MADKIFIADKETLDTVRNKVGNGDDDYNGVGIGDGTVFAKLNKIIWWMLTHMPASLNSKVNDLHSRIGENGDDNYTGNTSTLMGKVNHMLYLMGLYAGGWANCRDYLDTKVSSRQSESDAKSRYNTINSNTGPNHSANASGSLSQKLSYIINQLSTMGQKKLKSGQVSFVTSETGTHTILEVWGGGQFDVASTSMGTLSEVLTFEIDGNFMNLADGSGTAVLGRCKLYPQKTLTRLSGITDREYSTLHPLYFKDHLKITVNKTSSTEGFFYAQLAVYE